MIVRPIAQRWSPRLLPKLRLWLNADDRSAFLDGSSNPITNGASVEKWYCSQFGYDFNAQSTVSKRPIWNSTGMGTKSKPYVQFDGVTDILRCIDTNLLDALNLDTVGTVIMICTNSNLPSDNINAYIFYSGDSAGGSNNLGFRSTPSSSVLFNSITNNQSGVNNQIRQSQGVTSPTANNDEVYYICSSDGTQYFLRTLTNISGVDAIYTGKHIPIVGTDDGDWYGDIPNRDNITVGGYIVNSILNNSYCQVSEIIVTGEDIYSDATTLSYLDRYIKSKYGNLVNA